MRTPPFRIDVSVHDLLTKSRSTRPDPADDSNTTLPSAVFPRQPEKLADPGPDIPPDRRTHDARLLLRLTRAWLVPYLGSRLLPGDFHPITAYLFLEYKCNIDCWYCWSYNNKVPGMTEGMTRRGIDWLHDRGCRALGLIGGEPLLRAQLVHKVVDYASRKGFWTYIGTNGRLLKPELADRLGDAGVGVQFRARRVGREAGSSQGARAGACESRIPAAQAVRVRLHGVLQHQHLPQQHGRLRRLTEYAHEHRIGTDYHLNETPMLQHDGHFKHLNENPTYIRPEDWRELDALIDWLIEKNRAGYQMVNSVRRLEEMKAFARMGSAVDLKVCGWNGDGTGEVTPGVTPGVAQDADGRLQFAPWNCRSGQNNVVIRTDGTLAPCFPLYDATYDWGSVDDPKFDRVQLAEMKRTCQQHCFSTLNHNLAYCYNDARVIRWLWLQALNGFQGGARSMGG